MQLDNNMYDLLKLVRICFSRREDFENISEYVQNNLEFLDKLYKELESSIKLFNEFNSSKKIFSKEALLINSIYTKKTLNGKKLPSVQELFDELMEEGINLESEFIEEFNKFKFITEIEDYKQLLECTVVAFYRTYMLTRYPNLKKKNVQIASTIEEMLCVMYLNSKNTNLFQGIRHWIMDYEAEGFSKELADLISY